MAIRALSNIRHNGAKYVAGDIITDITKDQAQRLIDVGAAEQAPDNAKASTGKAVSKPSSVKDRLLSKNSDPSKRKTLVEKAQARQKRASKAVEAKVVEPSDTTQDVQVESGDKYTVTQTKGGTTQYRKNGKLISKLDYFTGIKKD